MRCRKSSQKSPEPAPAGGPGDSDGQGVRRVGTQRLPGGAAARSCYYAPAPERDDHDVIAMIEEYIRDNPRHGFDKMYACCATAAMQEPLYRVYRQLKLNLKRRGKRRLPARIKEPLSCRRRLMPSGPSISWPTRCGTAVASGRSTCSTTSIARRCGSRSIPVCRRDGSCGTDRAHRDPRRPPCCAWTTDRNSSAAISRPGHVTTPSNCASSSRQAEPERVHRALQPDLPDESSTATSSKPWTRSAA